MRTEDLRDWPGLTGVVADRIWTAWWQESGVSRAALAARLKEEVIGGEGSCALVALGAGDSYLGSALLIPQDSDSRPDLSPWLAALWTEPEARRQGVAPALIAAICDRARHAGVSAVYLGCDDELVDWYLRNGARPFARDGALNILRIALS